MEVLREGTAHQVTCREGCGSLLRWNINDVSLTYRKVNPGPYEVECMPEPEDSYHGQVQCPRCHRMLAVNLSRAEKRQLIAAQHRADSEL